MYCTRNFAFLLPCFLVTRSSYKFYGFLYLSFFWWMEHYYLSKKIRKESFWVACKYWHVFSLSIDLLVVLSMYMIFFFFFDRNDFSFIVYDFNKDGEWRASQEWFFHHIILEKSVSIIKEGQKQYYLWDMDIGNVMWTQNDMHNHYCIERKM